MKLNGIFHKQFTENLLHSNISAIDAIAIEQALTCFFTEFVSFCFSVHCKKLTHIYSFLS